MTLILDISYKTVFQIYSAEYYQAVCLMRFTYKKWISALFKWWNHYVTDGM